MTTRLRCITLFDITATGVLGKYQDDRSILNRADGSTIKDRDSWIRARHQQRNWETMNQIISLRCLPEDIKLPKRDGDTWQFEFSVPDPAALSLSPEDLEFLIRDADGVPMITNLEEASELEPVIRTKGARTNTKFLVIDNKYQIGE